MLWRASHTDTAKDAILGLIDVIQFGNPKESVARVVALLGPAVWERAEGMGTMRARAWIRTARNQPGEGCKWWEAGSLDRTAAERGCREDGWMRVPVCWILGLSGGDRLPQV